MRIVLSAALIIVALTAAPQAGAQTHCETVEVERVRQRQVELFDLTGMLVTSVSRRELGEITRALECPETPNFLGIQAMGRRWLVRRNALQVVGPEIHLPACAPGEYESYVRRNNSSSGWGSPPCRPG